MARKPLTVNTGQIEQLASGEPLDVGGWNLPSSGGTVNYVLTADASGHAIWAETSSDFGDPTADNQLLVATGVGAASWTDYLDELTIRNAGNDIAQLGSELVTNGTFASDLSGWTVGANWSWHNTGKAEHTAGSIEAISQNISVTSGVIYQVTYDWEDPVNGQLWLTFGSMIGNTDGYASRAGGLTYWSFKATSTGSETLTFTPESATTCKLDNVSVKAITSASDKTLLIEDSATASAMEVRADGTLENLSVGVDSGYHNIKGYNNTAWGFDAHKENVNGYSCTVYGHSAMETSLNAYECDAYGVGALGSMVFGWMNASFGYNALGNYIGGLGNTSIGVNSLDELTYGEKNVAVGGHAGRAYSGDNETSDFSVYLGYYARASADGADYEVVLGAGAVGKGTGTIVLGGSSHTAVYIPNDDMKLIFGGDSDFSLEWDQTDAVFTIASGKFSFVGGNIETSSAIIGSNIPSPTVDDQVLISTAAGVASWQTAGNDQYLASDGAGEVAWIAKPTLASNPTADDQVLISTGVDAASWSTASTNQVLASDGAGEVAWSNKSFGYNIPANSAINEVYVGTGAGTAAWTTDLAGLTSLTVDNITINGAVISSDTGAISFNDENLSTTGTVVGSNIPSPTADDQVLISTGVDAASWSTAGNDQYLASDDAGEVAWVNKPVALTDPTADDQLLVATGAGAASWTTTLDILTVDNINIDGAVISSDTGEISFSDENLSTTGMITANKLTSTCATMYTDGSATGYSGLYSYIGDSSETGTLVIDLPNGFQNTMMAVRIFGYNYTASGAWSVIVGGYTYTYQGRWLQHHASIQGNPPFTSVRLGWNGNTNKACIMLGTTSSSWAYPTIHIESMAAGLVNDTAYQSGWGINFYTSETNFVGQGGYYNPATVEVYRDLKSPTASGQIPVSNSVGGDVTWTTSLITLTNLTVDNININGATISSDTGAISFSNENLTTTGWISASNIPRPTADNQALTSSAADVASWNTTGLADVLSQEVPSASGAERKFVLTADPESQFEIEAAPWNISLTSDEDIYIETTGNDTTGDGSVSHPFASLERTIEYIGGLYIGDHIVTVNIGEGVFTETGTLTFQHPFGSQVIWKGVSEQITSQDTTSIGATGTSLGFNNLYYYDVTFTLPVGKSVSVGDYIAVREVSGGTNGEALYGCHYVSGWVSGTRVATVRVVYKNGATKATGTITCTVELIKTVVAFSNKNGLKISGPYHAGLWQGLVFQGDYNTTNTDAKYGVWLLNTPVVSFGGTQVSGEAIGIVGFQTGVYAQNNAMFFGDHCFVSRCGLRCVNAQNGGILNLRYARLSGANNNGIFCFNGSTAAVQYVKCVALGNDSISSYQGSFIDAQNAYVDQNNATYAFTADRWSGIDANSSSYSDSINPATGGNNDGSYVIIT